MNNGQYIITAILISLTNFVYLVELQIFNLIFNIPISQLLFLRTYWKIQRIYILFIKTIKCIYFKLKTESLYSDNFNMWALPSCFKITTTKIIDFTDQKIGHLEIFKICIYSYNHKKKN